MGARRWWPACLAPSPSVALYDLCRQGKWDEAMTRQKALWELNQAFAKCNQATCIKGGLELQGYDVGVPLPPQSPLSSEGRDELSQTLLRLGARTNRHY